VTLRDNTERPETIEVGSNVVSGTEPQSISEKSRMMLEKVPNWENPFGDGNAASKIIQIINNNFTRARYPIFYASGLLRVHSRGYVGKS